ncbi:GH1 family beta-glucosidase [Undibacterium cyanobacteriorum]|uniref:Beta-glucosidase n=1 Tax=Undibacterium cyanobacteriorum TaxID=3073561 RepID=A0ABY9RK46_9BURK|nr:GH1 family beta-glucosidase [Undibacterium sp. 20NA77.5]WMW80635.1 GH1 family beta-glucosidase [Undibacterium sp. 20NA77.5]
MDDSKRLPELRRIDFPTDFLWGCSTSSFQIEGAADTDGRVPSIWDSFAATAGKIRDGSDARVACDHYYRWQEDLDIAQSLGLNAYRFSISWPRVISDINGTVNEVGLQFYSDLVDGMLARGLQPWATLYHWDLPQYLQDQGGWENRATVQAYLHFADVISRRLGDRIKHWITHNEPWCTAMHGNWDGMHAPGKRDFKAALQVCHHVLLSHGLTVPLLRRNVADAKVGIALSLHPLRPASDKPEDIAATRRHDGLRNRWFLDPLHGRGYPQDIWDLVGAAAPQMHDGDLQAIAVPLDFLGVNYYFPEVIQDAPHNPPLATSLTHDPTLERTAFGWEVAPHGLVTLLKRLKQDYPVPPMYVTENGASYEDRLEDDGSVVDTQRRDYFIRHLAALQEARQAGVDVRGYFAWSLIDNFEWAEGYLRRFGLVYIDFETQQRTLKISALWYRDFLQAPN